MPFTSTIAAANSTSLSDFYIEYLTIEIRILQQQLLLQSADDVTASPCFFSGRRFPLRARGPPQPKSVCHHPTTTAVATHRATVCRATSVVYRPVRPFTLCTASQDCDCCTRRFSAVPRPFGFCFVLQDTRLGDNVNVRPGQRYMTAPCPPNIIVKYILVRLLVITAESWWANRVSVPEPSSWFENLAAHFHGRRSSMVRVQYTSEMSLGNCSPQPPAVIWQIWMKSWLLGLSSAVWEMESIRKWFYKPKVSAGLDVIRNYTIFFSCTICQPVKFLYSDWSYY